MTHLSVVPRSLDSSHGWCFNNQEREAKTPVRDWVENMCKRPGASRFAVLFCEPDLAWKNRSKTCQQMNLFMKRWERILLATLDRIGLAQDVGALAHYWSRSGDFLSHRRRTLRIRSGSQLVSWSTYWWGPSRSLLWFLRNSTETPQGVLRSQVICSPRASLSKSSVVRFSRTTKVPCWPTSPGYRPIVLDSTVCAQSRQMKAHRLSPSNI